VGTLLFSETVSLLLQEISKTNPKTTNKNFVFFIIVGFCVAVLATG
jgi:hypothetical protein